ncbi:MAG TPA: hypothetical protein DCX07_09955 [Phycisphaerales bacterium]|nr:hypothetical protein [Phycisphaerales bacterium]
MNEYGKLSEQFAKVRRAWKRAAVLSGLALVFLETAGIVALALLLNLFYGHIPAARFAIFGVALVAVGVLVVRHIVLPLARRIPDEQVALYIEEHSDEFEGALITAAEFGRRSGFVGTQAKMIEAVVHEADVRAEHSPLGKTVSWKRLRKYGVAAAASLAAYVALCAAFPDTVGRQVAGVFQPWRADLVAAGRDGQKLPGGMTAEEARKLLPIEFNLSAGDVRLARGVDFRLEAQLSREPQGAVQLHFHPVAQGAAAEWRSIPMTDSDKLYGYEATLESVSEEMDFFVSAEKHQSPTHRITVYDRLELQGVEVTVRYPEYLGFPDKVETLATGDMTAPIGSQATVRILANTRLASGKIVWADGKVQPLAVDAERGNTAVASFPVSADAQYTFEVTDVDGQTAASLGPSSVYALPDNPPVLAVTAPLDTVETHPLGEVAFSAEVTDDWGVASAELVYLRFDPKGTSKGRIPLKLQRPEGEGPQTPEKVSASLRWMLEEVQPAPQPGEIFSWHIEARDRKRDNEPAASDLRMIVILPFELWAAYGFEDKMPHAPPPAGPTLEEFLFQTWTLHREKPRLAPDVHAQRAEAIAQAMLDPSTGKVWQFVDILVHPELKEVAARVDKLATLAQKALVAHDTAQAVEYLQVALAELIAAGVTDMESLLKTPPPDAAVQTAEAAQAEQQRLAELFAETKAQMEKQEGSKLEANLTEAQTAAEVRKEIEQIRREQQKLISDAQELSRANLSPAQQAREAAKLAEREKVLAEKTRAAGEKLKRVPEASEKLKDSVDKTNRAARAMQAASSNLDARQVADALTKASEAEKLLGQVADQLGELDADQIAAALAEAVKLLEKLLRRQNEIKGETDLVVAALETFADHQPTAREKRDLKKVSFSQAELKAEHDVFEGKMDKLNRWAESGERNEVAQAVQKAHRTLQREQPGQKMTNAVVELAAFKAKPAADEQNRAAEGMKKVLADLREAANNIVRTREEALKEMVKQTKDIQQGLEKIATSAPKPAEQKPEEQPKPKPGEEPKSKPGEEPKPKPGEEPKSKPGEEPKAKPGEQPKPKPGELASRPKEQKDLATEAPAEKELAMASQITRQQRREIGAQIAADVRRLAAQVERRPDVKLDEKDSASLKREAADPALEVKLASNPAKQQDLSNLITRVSGQLETQLQTALEAKQLFSAQQDECPPRYRHLVNRYYQTLSNRPR